MQRVAMIDPQTLGTPEDAIRSQVADDRKLLNDVRVESRGVKDDVRQIQPRQIIGRAC
jgi:hypothetical protein